MENLSHKHCIKCDTYLSLKEFTSKAKYCRQCVKKYNNAYALKQGRKIRISPFVSETHKECCLCKKIKFLSEYSASTRGRMGKSAYCKPCASIYQLKYLDVEIRRKKTQKYRDDNREWWRSLHRINQFNRKNKIKLLSDGSVTKQFILEIYDTPNCYYCKKITPREIRTLDHKTPLNRGGMHNATNIVMSCKSCNFSKSDKTEEEYQLWKRQMI
jgi:5-methylcytosine-specific restriction endonuclease McrA